MLQFFKNTILILVIIFSIFSTFQKSFGNEDYIKLHPKSSNQDVKKFQKFFKALKIYQGEVDGNYNNIKPYIVDFQVKHSIISNSADDGAGYIGPKTYDYFATKYGNTFKKAYQKYFALNEPVKGTDTYFIVSAYYSPLPGQKRYSTGTYAGDIKLNGNGTHGASGVGVHPGFIAAPKNYNFGTKIELDGLGIGIVEDRGGAIVRAGVRGHEYDRLDIWMGYGDEGLERALQWGKKTVKGKIVNESTKITINFPAQYTQHLAKKISPESKIEDIKEMQELFKKIKLYSGLIDGKYNSFEKSVTTFQVKNDIIQNQSSYGAGYIGNKTIAVLEDKYPETFLVIRREDENANNQFNGENSKEKLNKIIISPDKNEIKKTVIRLSKTEETLKKFSITLKQKEEVDKLNLKLNEILRKKIGDNEIKIKSQKRKITKKIDNLISKATNSSLQNRLKYLKEILV